MGVLIDRWMPEVRGLFDSLYKMSTSLVYASNGQNINRNYDNKPASIWIPVDSIETYQDHISFGINGNVLLLTRNDEQSSFVVTDGNGEQLYIATIDDEDGVYQILDDRFHDYVKLSLIKTNEETFVIVSTEAADWKFVYDGAFHYRNIVGKNVDLGIVPHSPLIKNYSFGSFRGRIWATTLPMLKHYIVKGAGADIFPFVFPQNDYVTLYNHAGNDKNFALVTDKAHNLYMQYWVNTGLLSLAAWLAIVGFYINGALKSFRKHGFECFSDFVNGGIFCGVLGFLAIAFFNDGSVNTMPMFYTMLGTGLAINVKDKWKKADVVSSIHKAQMPEI